MIIMRGGRDRHQHPERGSRPPPDSLDAPVTRRAAANSSNESRSKNNSNSNSSNLSPRGHRIVVPPAASAMTAAGTRIPNGLDPPPRSPRSSPRTMMAPLAPLPEAVTVVAAERKGGGGPGEGLGGCASGGTNTDRDLAAAADSMDALDDDALAAPAIPRSSSPGTPPKKVWERSYRNFLKMSRIRQQDGGGGSGGGSGQAAASAGAGDDTSSARATTHLQRHSSEGTSKSSRAHRRTSSLASGNASDEKESSVRGGKLFASVFRGGSGSTSPGSGSGRTKGRKTKSLSSDELDVAMRRGSEKNYSPGNARYGSAQLRPVVKVPTSSSMPHMMLNNNNNGGVSIGGAGGGAVDLSAGGITEIVDLPYAPSPGGPPPVAAGVLLRPRTSGNEGSSATSKQIQQALCLDAIDNSTATTAANSASSSASRSRSSPPLTTAIISSEGSSALTSSAIKKAFTEFHNSSSTGRDAVSAYLGDDPSSTRGVVQTAGHSLAWTQNHTATAALGLLGTKFPSQTNLARHFTADGGNGGGGGGGMLPAPLGNGNNTNNGIRRALSHGDGAFLETVFENVPVHNELRVLKPIQSVDSWQTGRRYLIAPAALTACPDKVLKVLTGEKEPLAAKDAYSRILESQNNTNDGASMTSSSPSSPCAFGCILLGSCLLSSTSSSSSSGIRQKNTPQKQWSSAVLVLRQNYLLEYSPDVTVSTGLPRGFAHLQHAKCRTNSDFPDALELHFYGSPCAKSDKRVVMIRLQQREERDAWKECLNRASKLRVEDLYEFDEIKDELAKGSYASVYKARRKLAGPSEQQRMCALKVFDKNQYWRMVVKGRERADTLVRETSVQATVTAKCGQLNSFVKIFGFFETSDHVVIELELLEGTDLFKYITSKGVLKESTAAHLICDVLQSLEAMNRIGLAHRDIKPANILMCLGKDRPACKVADFGMSTFAGVDGHLRGRCGTPGYVAPEIFNAGLHGGYGNKVDVFSAGVTLHVMLCGYEPFYGETDAELIEANKNAEVEFPEDEWDGVSAAARDLVQKMMHPDPHQRLDASEALQHPWFETHQAGPGPHLDRRNTLTVKEVPADDACLIS